MCVHKHAETLFQKNALNKGNLIIYMSKVGTNCYFVSNSEAQLLRRVYKDLWYLVMTQIYRSDV